MPVEFKDQSGDAKPVWQTHQKKGSQSNISATIAGVVGEGAIKLQALQKWFKGDRGEGHEGMRQEYRRRLVFELYTMHSITNKFDNFQ